MRTRQLGNGGPDVTVVGLGTNNFGARIDYEQSLAVVDAAIEAGINLFDTADIYTQGTSEDFIGRAPEGRRAGHSARLARLHPLGRRRVAEAAAHRRDRPVPDARARSADADRGDA